MKEILEQTLLYDFYGELLTVHQRRIYEAFVFEDLSLSEIAEEAGVSRQSIHDLMKRCNRQLEDYEHKLHLVERFLRARDKVAQLDTLSGRLEKLPGMAAGGEQAAILKKIRSLSREILEAF